MGETPATPIEVVQQIYERFQTEGMGGLEALLAEDVVFREPPGHPREGHWSGREEVVLAAGEVVEALRVVGLEIPDILANESQAIAQVRLTLEGADGATYETEMLEQWRVREGRVVEIRPFYWDPHEISRRNAAA